MLRVACACLIALTLVVPLHATTVADFTIEELARFAHAGVRARVVATSRSDAGLARLDLDVDEVLFGQIPDSRLSLELDVSVAGMPELRLGDDVVLFLNFNNRVEKIIGLRWGTYRLRNGEMFDHDWRPLELTIETPVTRGTGLANALEQRRPREFLRRRLGGGGGSLPFAQMKTVVHAVRQRLIAEGTPLATDESIGN